MSNQLQRIKDHALGFFAPMPTEPPSEWCCNNLRFDEAGNRGPFTLAGREYLREPLDDWGRFEISDCVEVFGSQTGKTSMLMAGVAWTVVNDPCGVLWVMPSIDLARSFSETRWIKMLQASSETARLIPTGANRFDFKKLQQQIGSSVINFIGSNSPGNLASRPARKVVLDEVDKFDEGGGAEADAVNLAEQRTKGQSYPQRRKTSTPSIVEGLIWREYLKGDQRRYFVPCVHCGKFIVFAWSPEFSILPPTGVDSFVFWDKEAHKEPGGWDLDRVAQSARVQCCHCGGHILDGHKTRMIAGGEWRPTAKGETGFRSRQLSSLYASMPETTFGKLAVKFLQAKQSIMPDAMQGIITGDLAEPYGGQDQNTRRTESVTQRIELTAEWRKLMTVDVQQNAPFFWYVIRAWNGGNSAGVAAGSCYQWEEIAAIQKANGVADTDLFVDSRFNPSEVFKTCLEHGEVMARRDKLPLHFGWMPCAGVTGEKEFFDRERKVKVKYMVEERDPHAGMGDAGRIAIERLLFASDFYKDVLSNLRKGKGGFKWEVPADMATPEYWKHMDGERKVRKLTKWQWEKRHRYWPNHLFDCENMQVAAANFLELFTLDFSK